MRPYLNNYTINVRNILDLRNKKVLARIEKKKFRLRRDNMLKAEFKGEKQLGDFFVE